MLQVVFEMFMLRLSSITGRLRQFELLVEVVGVPLFHTFLAYVIGTFLVVITYEIVIRLLIRHFGLREMVCIEA